MSDELFENASNDGDKEISLEVEKIEEKEEETTPLIETPKKKPRKPRTEKRKAELREQLKRGRETSLAKRTKGKQKKDLVKLKVEESKIENVYKEKVMNDQQREQELEEKLTKKIMARMKKEAEEERKANELISLRKQVEELKKAKAKPLPTIKEEPIIPKAPVPVAPQYNKFSPSNHFMGGFY